MKNIRNKLFGFVLMYKTSLDLNPVLTIVCTLVTAACIIPILKILGF